MSRFIGYERCPRCYERGSDRSGDNLGVYSDGSKHCYACAYHVFPKHYLRVYEDVRTEDKAKLPNDASNYIPTKAWKWILQYGLSHKYWQPHLCYSEREDRLIIKVGDPIDFSLGRDMHEYSEGEEKRRKWWAYGDCHRYSHLYGPLQCKLLVCVEDVISAHKVGAAGFLTLPLFGTNVADCHLRTMLHLQPEKIVMWLDKDQQALATKRATRLSSLTGRSVINVFTEADPKLLPLSEINYTLKV